MRCVKLSLMIMIHYYDTLTKKQFNTYKEGLDLEFFDDRSGKLITCGSTSWSMGRYLSNHKAKQ